MTPETHSSSITSRKFRTKLSRHLDKNLQFPTTHDDPISTKLIRLAFQRQEKRLLPIATKNEDEVVTKLNSGPSDSHDSSADAISIACRVRKSSDDDGTALDKQTKYVA